MTNKLQNQALALAGVAQFALYSHELATNGNNEAFRIDIAHRAIFCTDPDSAVDVYGNLGAIADGVAFLEKQFQGPNTDPRSALVARYMGQLLRLAAHLYHNKQAQEQLRGVIDRARLADAADVETILNDGYQSIISPLKPQIMLHGHPSYLENPAMQARARTLLMAAVRCGFMWRQCGGNFIVLLMRRKALLGALKQL